MEKKENFQKYTLISQWSNNISKSFMIVTPVLNFVTTNQNTAQYMKKANQKFSYEMLGVFSWCFFFYKSDKITIHVTKYFGNKV